MNATSNSQTVLGRLGLAVLSTAVLAIAHRAEAQQFPSVQDFYTTETDALVLANTQQLTSLPLEQLEIISVEPVTWSNGCLGIHHPQSFCTQVMVPGWHVVVSDGEQHWVYHTAPTSVVLNPVSPWTGSIPDPVISPLPISSPIPAETCFFRWWPGCQIIGDPPPEQPGATQDNPFMPDRQIDNTWFFDDAPIRGWFDPPMTPGFRYTVTSGPLFSAILDFPMGIDDDDLFTVTVGDQVLGQFGPGQQVDFVAIFGTGIQEFILSDINPLVDSSDPTAFPLKLRFEGAGSSFTMTPLAATSVPEPSVWLGLIVFGVVGFWRGGKSAVLPGTGQGGF
ncbi:hypothetical protein [Leptolyngbya sp. PCC 6406]|uniref:hypothetical protein n=1 Tax=Leptolyngbya sp. PCC 6406 TaxID=1173264 RepID=UPI0002AC0BE3|nr:hypothetical protein [Leptolyngbya sp. PCC 6406]